MSCTIHVDAVAPSAVQEAEAFKVTWTLALADESELRTVTVTLLTDDARVVLSDQSTHDSPPERALPVVPGTKVTKSSMVVLHRRRGLIDETSRDGTGSPVAILARVRNERDETLAHGGGAEVTVHGLARRPTPRIFA